MTGKDIQMVDLVTQYEKIEPEVMEAVREVLRSSAYINGPWVGQFARALSAYTGSPHVIPCGNGTDALQIALMAMDAKQGDEIIVPSFTYVATVEVIALLGLTPVFVDVDDRTFNVDIQEVEEAITDRTRAVIAVHLFGQSADMEPLLELAKKHDFKVIEDNAQAIGAEYRFSDGMIRQTGTMGDIGTTSFFPSKNLGAYGDGGALFCGEEELAERIRMVGNHGQKKKYHHDLVGVNSRLDTLHAAILNVKLRHLDAYTERRQQVATRYDERLHDVEGLEIPHRFEKSTHVFHQYTLKIESGRRDTFVAYLKEKGIPSMIYYPIPQHLQQAYRSYGGKEGDYPVSEALSRSVCSIPVHTELDRSQQDVIIEHIRNFFN